MPCVSSNRWMCCVLIVGCQLNSVLREFIDDLIDRSVSVKILLNYDRRRLLPKGRIIIEPYKLTERGG